MAKIQNAIPGMSGARALLGWRGACAAARCAGTPRQPRKCQGRRRGDPISLILHPMSAIGTSRTSQHVRSTSAIGAISDEICSLRALPILTHLGHRTAAQRLGL